MIFKEDTKLMTSDGLKFVSELKSGDYVLDCRGNSNKVKSVDVVITSLASIITSKGRTVSCSDVKSILMGGEVKNIKSGAEIYSFHNACNVDIEFDAEYYLIGWLLGDGYYGKYPKVRELYFMANPDEISHLEELLISVGYPINLSIDPKRLRILLSVWQSCRENSQ